MRTFRTVIKTLVAVVVLAMLAILGAAYSGIYNVAATDEHWPVTRWLMHEVKEHSIALRADDLRAPDLSGRDRLLAGAAAYDRMCAHCHTPPGEEDTPVARGLYPAPPGMRHAAEEYTAEQIFWVIKHGIKMTGMPAWGPTHDDARLWSIVAFVKKLPELDAEGYRRLVTAAGHHGAGHHAGAPATTAEGGHTPRETGESGKTESTDDRSAMGSGDDHAHTP